MVRLFVCGDVVNFNKELNFVGTDLSNIIKSTDYAICNFEGPELKEGQTVNCPHQEKGTASYLSSVGFDLMLLANNHITELGADGVKHSRAMIKASGAECIGAGLSWKDAYLPVIKEINGLRFGFVNVCEAQVGQYTSPNQPFGYAWMGYDGLFDDVKKLSKETDYVIVFVHAGLEHYDIPIPEIRNLYRGICDAGASAVIGGHPHCAQGWEKYKNSLIVYSLGNFYFPLRDMWPQEAHSYSVILGFDVKRKTVEPVYHYNNGNCVKIDNTGTIDVTNLNEKLGDNYDVLSEIAIQKAYNDICKRLLIEATCGQDTNDSLKAVVYKLICYNIKRKKFVKATEQRRQQLLLRLFENETYRWTIIRYLKNVNKNY